MNESIALAVSGTRGPKLRLCSCRYAAGLMFVKPLSHRCHIGQTTPLSLRIASSGWSCASGSKSSR